MKHFRIVILLLLAVLLPVRGAVAAAMACPEGAQSEAARVVAESGHHDMHADAGMHAEPAASDHHADQGRSSGNHLAACHFCATGCCMASIAGTFPPMAQPEMTVPVVFPALAAPIPVFQSDGQERPPRTI